MSAYLDFFKGAIEAAKTPALKISLVFNAVLLIVVVVSGLVLYNYFKKSETLELEKSEYIKRIAASAVEMDGLLNMAGKISAQMEEQKRLMRIRDAEIEKVRSEYASATNFILAASVYRGDIPFKLIE